MEVKVYINEHRGVKRVVYGWTCNCGAEWIGNFMSACPNCKVLFILPQETIDKAQKVAWKE